MKAGEECTYSKRARRLDRMAQAYASDIMAVLPVEPVGQQRDAVWVALTILAEEFGPEKGQR